MTKPIFSKQLLSGILGFMVGFFAFIPIHFWMLAKVTNEIQLDIQKNAVMIEELEIKKLILIVEILAEYRKEINQMKMINHMIDPFKGE